MMNVHSIDDAYETLQVMIGGKGVSHREIKVKEGGILTACLGHAQCCARHLMHDILLIPSSPPMR